MKYRHGTWTPLPCLLLVLLQSGCAESSHEGGLEANDSQVHWGLPLADADAGTDAGTDTTPPDTRIDSSPALRTQETTATFTFSSTEGGGSFECRLTGQEFTSCRTPQTYSDLSDRGYTFEVRAVDLAANEDPSPATYSWTVDTTAPVVTINTRLKNANNATFEFSSDELGSFECKLDSADFSACASANSRKGSTSYFGLSEGAHDFFVRATDGAGNVSALATDHWVVDTSPDTTLGSTPAPVTRVSSATFSFSSNTLNARFECQLDTESFSPCETPKFYNELLDGQHLFAVRAIDELGRVDSSPAISSWRVDTTAPDTLLDLKPPALTNKTSASFQFSSREADVFFECKCDNAPFERCSNSPPKTCANLLEGLHSFSVRAGDGAGNLDLTPAFHEWWVDTTAPQAFLNGASTIDTRASFSFSSNEQVTFECGLDEKPFSPCGTTGVSYDNLAAGSHSFAVRAIDRAGNVGPATTPYSWEVDLTAPDTLIVSHPELVTRSNAALFSFGCTKGDCSFECSLDNAPFAGCETPRSSPALTDGEHIFRVFSVDAGKRKDLSPAFFSWTVDTQEPETHLNEFPPELTNSLSARFVFSSEPGSAFECSLDSNAYGACVSPHLETLTDGSHVFEVRAVDRARNADSSPARYQWKVDITPPDVQLNSHPLPSTNQTSATFSFSSRAADVRYFECSLDGSESDWKYVQCTAPFAVGNTPGDELAEGEHLFHVRVTDLAGNTTRTAQYQWKVDTTAPSTRIETDPPPTSPDSTSATFHFEANELGARFECRLDNTSYEPCNNPKSYPALSDTSHTFAVRAIDKASNVGPPATHSWTVNSSELETRIDYQSPGPLTRLTEATFVFSANKPVSAFKCTLDGTPLADCTSPRALTGLTDGTHTFLVYATDLGGRVDNTPASHTWVVDTVAPETTFSRCPDPLTRQATLEFAFAPSEPGARYECGLDGADFIPCPPTREPLEDGFHTLAARAVDKAGNIDRTPATCSFTVDTQAPETTLVSQPPPVIGSPFATFGFTSALGARFQCKLDEEDYAPCETNPVTYSNLPDGAHSFSVRAVDEAGNADATPAVSTFSITPAPLAPVVEQPAHDDVLATGIPTFKGSAQPGTTVSVFADDKLLGTTRVEETGRWSLEPAAPLQEGAHRLSATATNSSARSSPASPERAFTVDTTAPETAIDSGPSSRRTDKGEATFTFSSTEPRSSFACGLDGADFTACASPLTLEGLGAGAHRLRVVARDVAGNVDKSPAEYSWTLRVPLTGTGSGLSCDSSGMGGGHGTALLGVLSALALLTRRGKRLPGTGVVRRW
ncbi:Ig-like domain-containing protein [Archangium sp.]|uniref:Ig-like domain-containing protein n=1 Tax=Archangium sp. TaxID=1872627 RepID=UPI00389B02BE